MYNNQSRVRSFALTTYITIEQILLVLKNHNNIQYYAFIYHDKDIYDGSDNIHEKGQQVPPHFHIVLRLYNATTSNAVLQWFRGGLDWQNTFIEQTYSEERIFDYLTHENCFNEYKYHYEKNDIISNDISYFNNLVSRGSSPICISIIDDLIAHIPFREMIARYGRDFVINYRKYVDMASFIMSQEKPLKSTRDKPVVIRINDFGELEDVVKDKERDKQDVQS